MSLQLTQCPLSGMIDRVLSGALMASCRPLTNALLTVWLELTFSLMLVSVLVLPYHFFHFFLFLLSLLLYVHPPSGSGSGAGSPSGSFSAYASPPLAVVRFLSLSVVFWSSFGRLSLTA